MRTYAVEIERKLVNRFEVEARTVVGAHADLMVGLTAEDMDRLRRLAVPRLRRTAPPDDRRPRGLRRLAVAMNTIYGPLCPVPHRGEWS